MHIDWNKYVDYFDVDAGYYPEINEDSIKDPNNRWERTYAHEAFVAAIESLERILSRASNSDKKCLWVEGSYGTGKSRLLWTLQNLLDCPPEELTAYFNANDILRNKIDLRERLLAAKSGKIVTAFRYASGEISSTRHLINVVFDSLVVALKKSGCEFNGAKTLRGKIVSWLEADEANMQLFRAKVQSPKYRGVGAFLGMSADKILDRLKYSQLPLDNLVDEILTLGEQEGIRAFDISVDDLKLWISEVIDSNNLKAVVFFWDEFTDFFNGNRNHLGDFQKLVELVNSKPFYFVIATHMAKISDDASFKKLRDRFIMRNITMPNNIAFELISHALKVKPAAQRDWQLISSALKNRTWRSRQAVAAYIKAPEKVLVGILPIHPMAALMLKNISIHFASNQRSMFNFIKTELAGVDGFQQFISTRSPQVGDLLTIDYLWNFFYEQGVTERVTGGGRDNIDLVIATLLDSYARYTELFELTASECVVLKTILMMEAVTRKSQLERVKLLQPSAANLELVFEGVDELDGGVALGVARDLVSKKILYRQAGAEEIFATAVVSGNQADIDLQREAVMKNFRLHELIEANRFAEEFFFSAAQRSRFRIEVATVENLTAKVTKLLRELKVFQVGMVVCFSCDEIDRQKLMERICEFAADERYCALIFVDAGANYFGLDRLKLWADYMAHAEYWRLSDKDLSEQNKSNAEELVQAWRRKFRDGTFDFYPAARKARRLSTTSVTFKLLKDELDKNISELYPLSFDRADVAESLFLMSANSFRKGANLGLSEATYGLYSQAAVQRLLGDVWRQEIAYWELRPELAVSRLKTLVDNFIAAQLEKNLRVSFDDIFGLLMANGFMPCNLYAFLTGFLLKEYAQEPYRYVAGDGARDSGGTLTVERLATFIAEAMSYVLSPKKNYREYFLEVMSNGQRAFLKFSHEVFGTSEAMSVEQSSKEIRDKLSETGRILWLGERMVTEQYKPFCRQLTELVNLQNGRAIASLAEELGDFLLTSNFHVKRLKSLLTSKESGLILADYLRERFDGALIEVNLIDVVQKRLTGEALWSSEAAKCVIDNALLELKIVNASGAVGIEFATFDECVDGWIERLKFFHVPSEILAEQFPVLANFLLTLREMIRRGELPVELRQEFFVALTKNAVQIRSMLNSEVSILTKRFADEFAGLSESDKRGIIAGLPTSSFIDGRAEFEKRLHLLTEAAKKRRLNSELNRLWKHLTHSESPQSWSRRNRTPIIIMVSADERLKARRAFSAVGNAEATADEVRLAEEYLNGQPAFLEKLSDKRRIDEAFISEVIGERKFLLSNLNEVRAALEKNFGDAYFWGENLAVQTFLDKMTQEKYLSGANKRVMKKLMIMDGEWAKEFLLRLARDNYAVGIEILRGGELDER